MSPRHICFFQKSTDTSVILGKFPEFAFILDEISTWTLFPTGKLI